jgi:protein disulfide-isomerase A1
MKIIFLFFLTAQFMSEEAKQDENVYVLTDSNFKDFVSSHKYVLVKFYAPWCGHCKKMAPDYSKLGEQVHKESSDIFIAKLDATEHKTVSGEHSIQGFPTLKFFINGSPIDYSGAREKDAMYNWIQKKTGPASKHLTNEEDLKTHSEQKLSVVYFLPEGEDAHLNTYQSFAAGYDDISFAHSHEQSHKDNFDITKKFGFAVFRNFDEGHKFLTEDSGLTASKMKEFLEAHRFPHV